MSVALFEQSVGIPINYEAEGNSGLFANAGTSKMPNVTVSFIEPPAKTFDIQAAPEQQIG